MRKKFINSTIIFFTLLSICKADMLKPNKALKAIDVLEIQLQSLKNNNTPYKDAGIEQTWKFAHPNNKLVTGPLSNFKEMIYSKNYKVLINHQSSKILLLNQSLDKYIYGVNILSKDKKNYYYIWQIEKVLENGILKDCWLTTGVSNPKYFGETI